MMSSPSSVQFSYNGANADRSILLLVNIKLIVPNKASQKAMVLKVKQGDKGEKGNSGKEPKLQRSNSV